VTSRGSSAARTTIGWALLGPLVLGVALEELCMVRLAWPPGVPQAAFLVLGLWVGLLFDRASIKRAGRLFPFVLASAVGLTIACAALGWALTALTSIDGLTAYLATTPGGIDSVAIMALASGADAPLVLAVQTLRLFAVVVVVVVVATFSTARCRGFESWVGRAWGDNATRKQVLILLRFLLATGVSSHRLGP